MLAVCWALLFALANADATAQPDTPAPAGPAFSLSTSQSVTTSERAEIWLTFRQLPSLDFRVYKVRDPMAFLAGLRHPHQFGTGEAAPVPQQPTLIERIASWKAAQRRHVRNFVRAQTTPAYRQARRADDDSTRVSQRVTLQVNTFAQVPLLNPDQLVTSWRELLPHLRDPEMRRLPLDLPGAGVYVVEAVHERRRAYTVVVVSDVGVVAKASPGQMLLFAADRHSGDPRAECEARVLSRGATVASGRTSADGVLDVALPDEVALNAVAPATSETPAGASASPLAVVQCGDHVGIADPGEWVFQQPGRELAAFIYTDKPIYRPGHTVHLKAVLRWRQHDALAAFDRPDVEVDRHRPDRYGDQPAARPDRRVRHHGDRPGARRRRRPRRLRHHRVERRRAGQRRLRGPGVPPARVRGHRHDRRSLRRAGQRGGRRRAGSLLLRPAGGQRPRALHRRAGSRTARRSGSADDADPDDGGGFYGGDVRSEGDVTLGADGRGQIRLPLDVDDNGRDYRARIEARVTDGSGREVSGAGLVQATYGSFLVATRLDQYMARPGASVTLSARTLDYTGAARPEVPVRVLVERLDYADGYYSAPTVTRVSDTPASTDAAGQLSAPIRAPERPGNYRVAVVAREGQRDLRDDASLWVPGASDTPVTTGNEYLELLADKRSYAPGDTARIVVRGRDIVGPVLLTKEGQRVSWHQVVRPTVAGAFEIPVTEGDLGDVYVNVVLLRDGRLLQSERRLVVPPVSRTLQIALTPDRPVAKPQEPASFAVQVTDAAGQPVRASVSLAVIDESVFGVKADDTPDPARVFYRREYSRVSTAFSRDYYFMGHSGTEQLRLASRRRRPLSLADFKADRLAQPQVRKEFPDAIHWVASLVTDAAGRGRIAVRYPDSLTTWRLTARAVTTDTRVGVGVARTTTTKDLIVRLVTPRFLTEGDDVQTPTLVHNYLDSARETRVEVQATGVTARGATTPVSSAVDANGERRDPWGFAATTPGRAVFTATASTGTDRDALELTIPVLPYGVKREVSSTGSLAGSGETTQSLQVPASANPSARMVRVSLAPSMAGALLGAADRLTSFPYGCTEQTLSSFIPNLVVTRALADLQLAPTERLSVLGRQVTDGLQRLYDLQHDDGGWGWWASDGNHPFMTAYALSGLVDAQAHGYPVDGGRRLRAVQALAGMYLDYPRAVPELKAYVVWVLGRALGDRPEVQVWRDGESRTYTQRNALDEVWNARGQMSPYGQALLTLALAAANDARADEGVKLLTASARTEGALALLAGRARSAPRLRRRHRRRSHGLGGAGDCDAHARLGAARAGGALADAQPPRRMVEHDQAIGDRARRGADLHARPARHRRGRPGGGVRQRPAGRHPHLHAGVAGLRRRRSRLRRRPPRVPTPCASSPAAPARCTGRRSPSTSIRRRPRIARARASWRSRGHTRSSSRRDATGRSSTATSRSPVRCRPATSSPCGSPWPAVATGATC